MKEKKEDHSIFNLISVLSWPGCISKVRKLHATHSYAVEAVEKWPTDREWKAQVATMVSFALKTCWPLEKLVEKQLACEKFWLWNIRTCLECKGHRVTVERDIRKDVAGGRLPILGIHTSIHGWETNEKEWSPAFSHKTMALCSYSRIHRKEIKGTGMPLHNVFKK